MLFKLLIQLLFIIIVVECDESLERLDCYIENKQIIQEKECRERECLWVPNSEVPGIPWCFFDKTKLGYTAKTSTSNTKSGMTFDLSVKKSHTVPFEPIGELKFQVHYVTDRIVRFKIIDPNNKRYEVPIQTNFPLLKNNPKEEDETRRKYQVTVNAENGDFHFNIVRKETNTTVFDTSIGGLIYTDQYLQIATYLSSKNVYGFGENTHYTLKHDLGYKTWGIFAKDNPTGNQFTYGTQPYYMVIERDGKSHGVLFLNSNAMEYTMLPAPALAIKSLGGIFDFFVFLGDDPEHVVQLYTSLIGRSVMPPYWGLGFQLTRYGYKNTDHVKKVIDRNYKAKIPMDVHYVDIDYMNQFQDFTFDKENFGQLPALIDDTKKNLGLHWILILDPAIQGDDPHYEAFSDGYKNNVFIRWPKSVSKSDRMDPSNVPTDKDVLYGKVWPKGPAAFPDFFKNVTHQWWKKWIKHTHQELNLQFDGLWTDMNEPANFGMHCPDTKYDTPKSRLSPVPLDSKTICMSAVQGENDEYIHYNVHSLYGISQTIPTVEGIHETTGKRGFVVTRSNYVSSGRYAAHWLGDNASQWEYLRQSIVGMLEFSLFGYAWTGADICGFMSTAEPELCLRWSQMGAFYPFSRNHNDIHSNREQDPAVWAENGHSEVTDAARNALNVRYQLLPYLYTLFFRAHVKGETVARPLMNEYPHDSNTYNIDKQFLWGSSILISPILFPGQKQVTAYLPSDIWYHADWKQLKFTPFTSKGENVTLDDSDSGPPIHIRGGSIIPVAEPAVNTEISRKNPFKLLIVPKDKEASGDLFWDDGESVDTIESGKYNYYYFQMHSNCSLEIDILKYGYDFGDAQFINEIIISGTKEGKHNINVKIDGVSETVKQSQSDNNHTHLFPKINLHSKSEGKKWKIDWSIEGSNECNM